MKNILWILTILLVGCTPSHQTIIEEAERLLQSGKSDSALAVIHRIYQPESLEQPWQARYALAVGQAHAVKGEAMTEDSLLLGAYNYYRELEPKDSARWKQSVLLAARYHWWVGESEKAYGILLEPLEGYRERKDTLSVIRTLGLAIEQYSYENRYADVRDCMKQLIAFNKDSSNALQYWDSYGAVSAFLNDTAEVKRVYEEIIPPYLKQPYDTAQYHSQILNNYANLVSSYGDQRKAIALHKQIVDYFKDKNEGYVAWAYACLSRCYLLQGNLEEARRYMQLCDASATEEMKTSLAYVSSIQLVRSVLEYACNRNINLQEWAELMNNLLMNEDLSKQKAQAKEEANRQLVERNLNLTIDRQRTQIVGMYVVFALAIVIVVLVLYNRRKKHLIEEKEEELETLRQLVNESQQHTESKDDRFFKKIMLQQLGVIRMAASNPTAANQELIKRMSEIANKEVEVDTLLNWDDLYQTIDYIYDGYYTHLKTAYGTLLNEKEIQLCCLLRANFSTKEISIVTQQGVRTVYQRKTVVRQKLQMEEKGDIAEFLS